MLLPVRTVAPAAPLLTAAEIKAQSRVDGPDDDAIVTAIASAIAATLDGYAGILGRALITQTWAQVFDGFSDMMRLPLAPVQSATVGYVDPDGQSQTLADAYRLHEDAVSPYLRRVESAVLPAVATRDDAVTITMVCGYGSTAASVPQDIIHAAKLMASHFFDHREAVGAMQFHELPMGARWLLERYRMVGV